MLLALAFGLLIRKWSAVRPLAKEILEECLDVWSSHTLILSEPNRWTPASAPKDLPSDYELTKKVAKLLPSQWKSSQYIWAACYNMRWTKLLESLGVEQQSPNMGSLVQCVAFVVKDGKDRQQRCQGTRSARPAFSYYIVIESLAQQFSQ